MCQVLGHLMYPIFLSLGTYYATGSILGVFIWNTTILGLVYDSDSITKNTLLYWTSLKSCRFYLLCYRGSLIFVLTLSLEVEILILQLRSLSLIMGIIF